MSTGVSNSGNRPFQLDIGHDSLGTNLTSPSGEELRIPTEWMEALEVVLGDRGNNQIRNAVDNRDLSNLSEVQFDRLKSAYAAVETGIADGSITVQSLQQSMMSNVKERAFTLDAIVDANMDGMQAKNDEIADVNRMMQEIRAARPGQDTKGAKMEVSKETWEYIQDQPGWKNNFSADIKGNKVTLTASKDKSSQFLLDNFKTKIDELSSNSQLEMIQLQGMINKRNQAYELLSTLVKQFANATEKAVNNLR